MVKKIAVIVLIVIVLSGFSVSAIRIIMRGSVRSQKTEEEIKMSEIIEKATKMGTYSSDIYIRVGESIAARDLLESSLSSPVSVGTNLPYVNLSKCNIYFDNGKTKEEILSPGKKKFTIIVSFEAINRDYVYYVELEADEAPVTTVTKQVTVTSGSHHSTITQKEYYEEKPKKTQAATKPVSKKPVSAVTTIGQTLPSTDIVDQTPVTEPPQTDAPPDIPVTPEPSVPDNPPEPVEPPPSDQQPEPSEPEQQPQAEAE